MLKGTLATNGSTAFESYKRSGEPGVSKEAFLVPVLPAGIDLSQDARIQPTYVVPRWAETRLVPTERTTIGREASASLIINHNTVSRHHAEIVYSNGQYLLRDLGSKNGTFLNGVPLEPYTQHILKQYDRVRIGMVMTYMFQERIAV